MNHPKSCVKTSFDAAESSCRRREMACECLCNEPLHPLRDSPRSPVPHDPGARKDRGVRTPQTLITEGHRGDCLAGILRAGNAHTAEGIAELVTRAQSLRRDLPPEDRQEQQTLFTPETFDRKLKALEGEKRSYEEHIQRAEENASEREEELIDALTFSLKLRQRFEKGGRDTRRGILCRLKDRIQLTDGKLDSPFRGPFRTLARENVRLERKHGSLQPYDVPLYKLKSEVREKESVRKLAPLSATFALALALFPPFNMPTAKKTLHEADDHIAHPAVRIVFAGKVFATV